jgi:hypothetical protein
MIHLLGSEWASQRARLESRLLVRRVQGPKKREGFLGYLVEGIRRIRFPLESRRGVAAERHIDNLRRYLCKHVRRPFQRYRVREEARRAPPTRPRRAAALPRYRQRRSPRYLPARSWLARFSENPPRHTWHRTIPRTLSRYAMKRCQVPRYMTSGLSSLLR